MGRHARTPTATTARTATAEWAQLGGGSHLGRRTGGSTTNDATNDTTNDTTMTTDNPRAAPRLGVPTSDIAAHSWR